MQPYFLSFCLQNSHVDNVKDEVLSYLNDEVSKWVAANPVASDALVPLISTETSLISDQTFDKNERHPAPGSEPAETTEPEPPSGVMSPTPMSPVRPSAPDNMPFSPGALSPPSLLDLSSVSPVPDPVAETLGGDSSGSGSLRLIEPASADLLTSTLFISDAPGAEHASSSGVDVDAEQREKYEAQRTKIRGKFREASVETEGTLASGWRSSMELAGVFVMVLHRFGKEWPKEIQSAQSRPTSPESSLIDLLGDAQPQSASSPLQYLDAGSLLTFVTTTIERLLFLHERKLSVLATFDFVVVLSLLRQLFNVFPFTCDAFKQVDAAKRLLYYMYELYFILFKPDKKEILDYSSFDQVDAVFNFFWRFLRDRPWMRSMESANVAGISNWDRAQERFVHALCALAQSSASIERSVFPIQRDPINFDFNDDPVRVLDHFILLINSLPPQFPTTLRSVWDSLFCGIDPNEDIPAVATSTTIKAKNLRALSVLSQRAAARALYGPAGLKQFTIDDLGFPAFDPQYFSTDRLRRLSAAAQEGKFSWQGIDLLSLVGPLIDVLKSAIDLYAKNQTMDLAYELEAIRSIVLLSDFYFTQDQQWQWMLDAFSSILDSQNEPWLEDTLAKQYLLLGCCKAAAVLAPVLEKSPPSSSSSDKNVQLASKFRGWLRFCVGNMKLRELEIHEEKKTAMPIPTTMFMYSVSFLLESRTRVSELVFKGDDEVSKWINYAAGDFRQSAFARNVSRACAVKLQQLLAGQSAKVGAAASEAEPDIKFIEEVKNLFIKIRKSPLVHVERLAKTTIPSKLIQSFNPDQMLSMLIGELARPEAGVQNIALILYHTLSKLKEIKTVGFSDGSGSPRRVAGTSPVQTPLFLASLSAGDIDATVTRWILMCLESFVQLANVPSKLDHAQWALAALFLAASPNPLQRILFFDLIAEQELHVDNRVFVLAGVDFYCNQAMDINFKRDMVATIKKMKGPAFQSLCAALEPLLEEDVQTSESGDGTYASPPASPTSSTLAAAPTMSAPPPASATAKLAPTLNATVVSRSPLQVLRSVISGSKDTATEPK